MAIESFENRLTRFVNGSPNEIFFTILNSFENFIIEEIRAAGEREHENLLFLGAHAVIQTVSEKIFGLQPLEGTRFYLLNFVDGDTHDRRFSIIADDIHELRNVKAHSWSSAAAHRRAINYIMAEGWQWYGDTLHINPRIFMELFVNGFGQGGRIWQCRDLITPRVSIIQKYRFIRDWLALERRDPISVAVRRLSSTADEGELVAQEATIKTLIGNRYRIAIRG